MAYSFSIGVLTDSFRADRADISVALQKARVCGVQGVQISANYGAITPENMDAAARRHLKAMVQEQGLVISALCGDLGGGFGNPERNPELIERSKRILDLAKELGTDVVTTHIGVVPGSKDHPRYQTMQQACFQLAQYADSVQAHFAIETGPETAAALKAFLDGLGSTGVAVNLDPANLVMVTGDDPVQAVYTLQKYIVHTHAKDGRKLLDRDPEIIYSVRPVEEVVAEGDAFIELPLGEGDVDWPGYLKALDEIGYNGFLTIEREVGADPEKDIRAAVQFLQAHMA